MAGLGDKLKPLLKMLWLVNQPQHHIAQTVEFSRQNIRRMIAGRHIRIDIALATQFTLQNIVGKAAEQLAGIWRAIAYRIVQRVFEELPSCGNPGMI